MSKQATPALSVQVILIAAIAWAIISLLFFLLFSVPLPGQGRPTWYNITTYILENMAFLGAGLLCFRNWRSSQIVSGRVVWLLIGLGMISFFIGNLILGWWEIVWQKEPDVSPGDFFFLSMYVLVGIGMFLAITARKLNLSLMQWMIVLGVGVAGAAISYVFYNGLGLDAEARLLSAPAVAQEAPAETAPTPLAPDTVPPDTVPTAPAAAPAEPAAPVDPATVPADPATAPTDPTATPTDPAATPADPTAVPAEPVAEADPSNAPEWAIALEERLTPFGDIIGIAYVIGDIVLLMAASSLLIAFWGGRFSLSWRFIAAAAFCFFIADTWFLYAITYIENYQTGALPEVFWIFSACLFAMGAALEYDLSGRSRRGSRRRAG